MGDAEVEVDELENVEDNSEASELEWEDDSSSKKCWDSVDMYLQNARIMKENQRQVVEIC